MNLSRKNIAVDAKYPIKIIQFGEGNFLRAFVDFAFQKLNNTIDFNAGIAVVQPIDKGLVQLLNDQDGLYTLFLRGYQKGKEVEEKHLITNIEKSIDPYQDFQAYLNLAKEESLEFIISNTTEAGISYVTTDCYDMQPPTSFPAKLTVLLHKRFEHFNGAHDKGLTIIPCELINYNADTLNEIILKYINDWNLGSDFKNWIINDCSFHNTLVDRIVPGYPKDEIEDYNKQLEYKDNLIVTAETFFLWVIEGDDKLKRKLPFEKTNLDVKIVNDMQPYRTRKVRILNGAHTTMVPFSILYGNDTVKETIDTNFTGDFIKKAVFEEIIATLNMDHTELTTFGEEVFDRFRNPFIKHQLSSIALNSISKFKVRVLPSLLDYEKKNNKLPLHLTFAFACLIRFYKGTWNSKDLPVNDDQTIVAFFNKIWASNDYSKIAHTVLSNQEFWEQDLTKIPHLENAIAIGLEEIDSNGIEVGFSKFQSRIF